VTSVSGGGGGGNDRPSSTTTTADIEDDVASALILMHLERLTIPKFKASAQPSAYRSPWNSRMFKQKRYRRHFHDIVAVHSSFMA
jgi:hypothetical protein